MATHDSGTVRRLRGKVAIIVGGGRGIGEAIAIRYAQEGANVMLAARTAAELAQVARKVRNNGGQAEVFPLDVAEREQTVALVQATQRRLGGVHVLVNAAGTYGPIGPLVEVNAQQWARAFQVNLFGTFNTCQAVLPLMIKAREGSIINFSGGGATAPLPQFSAYGVSKAAVVRLTETLAEEVKPFNIRVNAIAPGAVDTRLQDEVLAAGRRAGQLFERIRRMRETGEGATPRDLPAELAVFLASEETRGLTGRLIAAPHDGWQSWDEARITEIMAEPWFTLRRIDPFTVRPLLKTLLNDEQAKVAAK